MKTKCEIFLQWNTKFPLQKVLGVLYFGSCQNCMSSANLIAEIHWKLCNKKDLSTGGPCTCEYVTLLQPFHRGTVSIHWYIAQNVNFTISMFVLFRRPFKTAIFSRFLKIAMTKPTFILADLVQNISCFIEERFHISILLTFFHWFCVFISYFHTHNLKLAR